MHLPPLSPSHDDASWGGSCFRSLWFCWGRGNPLTPQILLQDTGAKIRVLWLPEQMTTDWGGGVGTLKTTRIYVLTVLVARSLKTRCG